MLAPHDTIESFLTVWDKLAATPFLYSADTNSKESLNLFDGKSLEGWTPNANGPEISVKDGIIQMLSVKQNL